MTCSLPRDIEQQLTARAAVRQTTVEELVVEALSWYLNVEDEVVDELAAWQRARDEASGLIEDQMP